MSQRTVALEYAKACDDWSETGPFRHDRAHGHPEYSIDDARKPRLGSGLAELVGSIAMDNLSLTAHASRVVQPGVCLLCRGRNVPSHSPALTRPPVFGSAGFLVFAEPSCTRCVAGNSRGCAPMPRPPHDIISCGVFLLRSEPAPSVNDYPCVRHVGQVSVIKARRLPGGGGPLFAFVAKPCGFIHRD